MTKLYKKNELTFAILWIVAYIVFSSLADQLSESIGTEKAATAVLHIVMSLVLLIWIRKSGLSEKYGFCASKVPAKRFLYYLPLVIIASASLWNGISLRFGLARTACYVISMCCVGFLEEGYLPRPFVPAMEKDNPKTAIIVSALTFGLGHIVNLFNGKRTGHYRYYHSDCLCRLSWFCAGADFLLQRVTDPLHPVPFGE